MEYVLSPTGLMPRIGIGKNQADLDSFFIVSTLYGTTSESSSYIPDICVYTYKIRICINHLLFYIIIILYVLLL